MRIEENAGGGDTVILEPGDSLARIPESHRELISPAIRKAFADPEEHFRGIARRSQFVALSQWISALISESRWELELNRGCPFDERANWTMAGFRWRSDSVCEATIGLPDGHGRTNYPATLAQYFRLVDVVHWTIFGGAGGLEGAADAHTPISSFAHLFNDPKGAPQNTFVLGWSGCGDMLIYSNDDRGGWLSHENGRFHWLGSIEDMLNWIFRELLSNREPQYDYAAWKR